MQLTKYLFLMLCTFFSVNSFADVIWGSKSLGSMKVLVQGVHSKVKYADVLSIDKNGLLDNSNKIKVDFSNRESQFPEMELDDADIQLISGTFAIRGCKGFNQDCDFLDLTARDVENLLTKPNSIASTLYMINRNITQSGATDKTATIYVKSNMTGNQYVELATYRMDIPRMTVCIGRMDSDVWDLGKISPASFSAPKQIKIASMGAQRSVVKFASPSLVNNVLTMREGDKIGPSIEFKGKDWFQCADANPNAVCAYIGTLSQSADTLKVTVNGMSAEPGKYTSYLTSTVDCN